jgi:hypothetical protein
VRHDPQVNGYQGEQSIRNMTVGPAFKFGDQRTCDRFQDLQNGGAQSH